MSSKPVQEGPLAEELGGADHYDHGDATSQVMQEFVIRCVYATGETGIKTMLEESRTVTVVWKGVLSEDTFIFGSWDSWENGRKVTKRGSAEEYGVVLKLVPGWYEFKYRSSGGVWFHDSTKPTTVNVYGTLNNVLNVPGAPNIKIGQPGEPVSFNEAQRVHAACIAFRGEVEERLTNGGFPCYVPVFYQAQVVAGMNYKIVVNVGKNDAGEDILVLMEVFWGLGNATPKLTSVGFYKDGSEQKSTK